MDTDWHYQPDPLQLHPTSDPRKCKVNQLEQLDVTHERFIPNIYQRSTKISIKNILTTRWMEEE